MIKRQKSLWMVLAMLMPQVFKASTVTIADIQSLTLSDGTGFSNFSAFQSAFNGA
ncbi:hypothetical protein HYV11_04120, partial [Candidatus Dependentiae bacterium]|nr:hypothetical protein [Candidatus Dependentiae bacterium]